MKTAVGSGQRGWYFAETSDKSKCFDTVAVLWGIGLDCVAGVLALARELGPTQGRNEYESR
jgi:hypothetical protein